MNSSKKKKTQDVSIVAYLVLLMTFCIFILSGCKTSNIPFNGEVLFYDLSIEIPEDFIRDSTKSNDNQYVFEKNNYDVIIVLSKQNTNGYSLRNIVSNAQSENGTVLYHDDEYTTCDIEYELDGGVYSFTHSQIYNDDRYQIVVQSKDESNARLVYNDLLLKAVIGENIN